MSNTSLGRGDKGSKFWMQVFANAKNYTDYMDILKETAVKDKQTILDDVRKLNILDLKPTELEWVSPCSYAEYADGTTEINYFREFCFNSKDLYKRKLNNRKIFDDKLGGGNYEKSKKSFRSEILDYLDNLGLGQPHWDGIAFSKDYKTLYLFEAKAHSNEINNRLNKNKFNNLKKAYEKKEDNTTSKELSLIKNFVSNDDYRKNYYQTFNRILFYYKAKELFNKLDIKITVKLVFLDFVEDYTHIPENIDCFIKKHKVVFEALLGTNYTLDSGIHTVFAKIKHTEDGKKYTVQEIIKKMNNDLIKDKSITITVNKKSVKDINDFMLSYNQKK